MRCKLTKKRYNKTCKKNELKSHAKSYWANKWNQMDIPEGNYRRWISEKYYGHEESEVDKL